MFDLLSTTMQSLEAGMRHYSPLGMRNALVDMMFYDVSQLGPTQLMEALWAPVPEGSILIIRPGKGCDGIGECICPDTEKTGADRARAIAREFEHYQATHGIDIDTIVVAGCGSSMVGAAAFGKQVAEILDKPVASIVTGYGVRDAMFEALSGAFMFAPVGRMLHLMDPVMDLVFRYDDNQPEAKTFRAFLRNLAAPDLERFIDGVPEAATLREVLASSLLSGDVRAGGEATFRKDHKVRMIVSHSKGNWAVSGGLFGLKLMMAEDQPVDIPPIDVVTLGCWTELPEHPDIFSQAFRYHQYFGTNDLLGLFESPRLKELELLREGRIHTSHAAHDAHPDEGMFAFRGHNLVSWMPNHMPVETILSDIQQEPRTAVH